METASPAPENWEAQIRVPAFAPANGTTEPLNLTKPEDRQHWGTGKERHGVRDWALDNGLAPVGVYVSSGTSDGSSC
ncbi:hypothetical protein DL766_009088 [Monosporascus sp. MC13-8B]|uniref:Uncharacterized protein n=1 Tax=Monosporascus cannonballus TaxID=155416 RepID=A0ABY0GZ07_9PEZI|nr:hypothetical protein DL763_010961 [Monosporascus cannonballus]RYO78162.1 hypothetical protein DL762_008838 [Monosporascus cannonballus]RYP16563.1 hypothetical protein DL766_009088 [Monosporascus sp. MC13-8B]